MKIKSITAFVCALAMLSCGFVFDAHGQKARSMNAAPRAASTAPSVTATLTDSFADTDGDGKAKAGDEITYTATIANNGTSAATNVTFNSQIDNNTTLVPGSVQVENNSNYYAVRCTFNTGSPANDCVSIGNHDPVTSGYNRVLGLQNNYLVITPVNVFYNSNTEIYQFDATVQNLTASAFGTINGVDLDPAGVKLFVQETDVQGGTGSISVANQDGTAVFTGPDQPYFQYNQMLARDEVSASKTLQFNVPNTVTSFTVDFLVSTTVQANLVINEILSNPGGTISDASGEWFEVYNAGSFPVDMQNYLINDFNSTNGSDCTSFPCNRPSHIIASSVTVQPGGYVVLGNTTNTTNNGGVPVDYSYGAALAFANSQDGVRIQSPNPADPASPLTIDQSIFRFPGISAQNGISRELKNPALDNANIDGSNWGDASVTAVYGPGGRGTPKAQNSDYTPYAGSLENLPPTSGGGDDKIGTYSKSLAVNAGGEIVSADIGIISAGATATVTYKVTIANPLPAGTTQTSNQATIAGDGFSVFSDDPATDTPEDATVTLIALAPTAATVNIGGRVMTPAGRGVSGVIITLTDQNGTSRTAQTSAFGYYHFAEVSAGETYVITAKGRRFSITQPSHVLNIAEDTNGVNFIVNSK